MSEMEKIFASFKNKYNNKYSSYKHARELVAILANSYTENEILDFKNKYMSDVESVINGSAGKKKSQQERVQWIKACSDGYEVEVVNQFSPALLPPRLAPKKELSEIAKLLASYGSSMSEEEYLLQRAHAESAPLVDLTKIKHEPISMEEFEKMHKDLLEDL